MKKSLVFAIILASLLLSACQPQPSSPQQIATYCQDVDVFMQAVDAFAQLGSEASEAEYKAAYGAAVAAGNQVRLDGEDMDEQEVEDFKKAAENLAVALDYAKETVPSATNYLQTMTEVKTQYAELQVAYQDLQTGICAP